MSAENDAAVWEHMQQARARVVREACGVIAKELQNEDAHVAQAFRTIVAWADTKTLAKLGRLLK